VGEDFFGLTVEAITKGCTFEGLEAAEPELKKITAYRSAKSAIRKATKNGVKLLDAETGLAKSKGTLAKESSGKGVKEDAPETVGGAGQPADKVSAVAAALAILKAEPAMRKAFALELRDLARTDEVKAAEPTTRMGAHASQRTEILGAAVAQEQKAA